MLLIACLIFSLLNISSPFEIEKIINNPVNSSKDFNPINYRIIFETKFVEYKIKHKLISVEKHIQKLYYDSYIFDQNLFLCINQLGYVFFVT